MNRGLVLLVVFASSAAVAPSQASQPDFRLQVVPATVYKVDDPGGARTSSFVFNTAVICSTDCELTPISARVELFSGGSIVETQDWSTEMLAQIKWTSYRIEPNTPLASPTRVFTLPEAFDVRSCFRHPQALAIDSAVVRLTVADVKGRRAEQTLRIPIRYYQQKTALTVPFRGKGVVGQDWITNGGHGGVWNAFAVDMRGLDSNYASQLNDANENASDAGWDREILAPAAGTVIYARNDVPTNPRPGEQPDVNSWYLPLRDPVMAYAGNCAIIDHGNSEYSVMMHCRSGFKTSILRSSEASSSMRNRLRAAVAIGGSLVAIEMRALRGQLAGQPQPRSIRVSAVTTASTSAFGKPAALPRFFAGASHADAKAVRCFARGRLGFVAKLRSAEAGICVFLRQTNGMGDVATMAAAAAARSQTSIAYRREIFRASGLRGNSGRP